MALFENPQCFLCQRALTQEVMPTKEHVIPKWVMAAFGLAFAQSSLPNQTLIRYTQRTIPCCRSCNAWLHQTLEQPVSAAFQRDLELPPFETTYLWLMKLYYGARVLETRLAVERADASAGAIRAEYELGMIDWMRLALLAGPTGFREATASGSLLAFPAGMPADSHLGWDMYIPSDQHLQLIGVRLGPWAMIASFGDGGWLRDSADEVLGPAPTAPLHPLQVLDYFATAKSALADLDIWMKAACYKSGAEQAGSLLVDFASSVTIVGRSDARDSRDEDRICTLLELLAVGRGIGPLGPVESFLTDPRWNRPLGTRASHGSELDPPLCHDPLCPEFLTRLGILTDARCDECGAGPTLNAESSDGHRSTERIEP